MIQDTPARSARLASSTVLLEVKVEIEVAKEMWKVECVEMEECVGGKGRSHIAGRPTT